MVTMAHRVCIAFSHSVLAHPCMHASSGVISHFTSCFPPLWSQPGTTSHTVHLCSNPKPLPRATVGALQGTLTLVARVGSERPPAPHTPSTFPGCCPADFVLLSCRLRDLAEPNIPGHTPQIPFPSRPHPRRSSIVSAAFHITPPSRDIADRTVTTGIEHHIAATAFRSAHSAPRPIQAPREPHFLKHLLTEHLLSPIRRARVAELITAPTTATWRTSEDTERTAPTPPSPQPLFDTRWPTMRPHPSTHEDQ
jgi:hypothetical protein